MKNKLFLFLLILVITGSACKKDSEKAPSATITGQVVFNKQKLGLRSNGVQLELWQRGFELFSKIPVYVDQDGTFSAKVFNGNYKLTLLKGNGPWVDKTDTIDISVNGSADVEVNVDPYFLVNNATFTRNGSTINASFNVQSVNTSKPLELVRMYVGQTIITDQNNNAGTATKQAAVVDITQPVAMSVNVPGSLAAKDYVFVRVAVKTKDVGELVYSEPVKISLK
jgi:hypothetical protein